MVSTQNSSHTYNETGRYSVTLQVTDANAVSNTTIKSNLINAHTKGLFLRNGNEAAVRGAVTNDGGFVMCGGVVGSNVGAVLKSDKDGIEEWFYTYPGGAWANSITEAPNGDLLFISNSYPITLMRVNQTGQKVWETIYADLGNVYGQEIINTGDGGFLIIGSRNWNVFLLKVDDDGNAIWNIEYGAPDLDVGRAIVEKDDGTYLAVSDTRTATAESNVLVTNIDLDGNTLWSRTVSNVYSFSASSIAPLFGGDYIVSGSQQVASTRDDSDAAIIRIDGEGNTIWRRAFGTDITDSGESAIQVESGDILFATNSESFISDDSGHDIVIRKISPDGVLLFQKSIGGEKVDRAGAIQKLSGNEWIVFGYTASFSTDAGNDMWAIKLDVNGDDYWAKH